MTEKLLNQLVDSEIKVSELSTMILARDSRILSLEMQVELLKFQLLKEKTKKNTNFASQTDALIQKQEKSFQTNYNPIMANIICQTDEEEKQSKELSDTNVKDKGKNTENYEKESLETTFSDKENNEGGMSARSIPQMYIKLKNILNQPLNFISAINLKSDLPVKDTRPRMNSLSTRHLYSQN
ncbi:hypothetical protein SteCoe_464 [Stentor coeruleus]|uniref:Uncharacterized protein n=1 Tax=Stentor coeruleus TaxID=5963 RepID=A0A1R2D4E1_9CILI|nr:hypothetical protein SteCoe_464 [Stentor coeruleus]